MAADKPICDLCSEPNPTWVYPAEDFPVILYESIISLSSAGWEACDTCHALIEDGNTEALAIRCLDQYLGEHTGDVMDVEGILNMVHEIHGQFFEHRLGPAYRQEVTVAHS